MRTKTWPRILASRRREYQGRSDTAQLPPGTRCPGKIEVQPKVFDNFIPDKTHFTCMIEVAGIDMIKNELVKNLGTIDEEVSVWSVAMTDRAPRAWLCTQNRCDTPCYGEEGQTLRMTTGLQLLEAAPSSSRSRSRVACWAAPRLKRARQLRKSTLYGTVWR